MNIISRLKVLFRSIKARRKQPVSMSIATDDGFTLLIYAGKK